MKHISIIRAIYLYLFTIIGLVLLTVGGVRFADMGLKAFVFTKAEADYEYSRCAVLSPYPIETIEKIEKIETGAVFSEEELSSIKQWIADYKKQSEQKISYATIDRHKNASINLAMILIGLPLYLYHWLLIKKETKEREV